MENNDVDQTCLWVSPLDLLINFISISFREQTLARKWGWDDGVTSWAGRPRGNWLRFREEDDDCHGPAALQAIVLALAADETEQFRKQPEPVLGYAAGQASRAVVRQKSSSTYRLYRWELEMRMHCESHRESMRQGTLLMHLLWRGRERNFYIRFSNRVLEVLPDARRISIRCIPY